MKKEYTAPSMQRVALKAEEAVLTACKTWSNGGTGAYMPGGMGTFTPGTWPNCQSSGGWRGQTRRRTVPFR